MKSPLFSITVVMAVFLLAGCGNRGRDGDSLVDISGVVKDSDGNPLANAFLKIDGPKSTDVTTDDNGRFKNVGYAPDPGGGEVKGTQYGVPPGEYTLSVQKEGGKWTADVSVKKGQTDLGEITMVWEAEDSGDNEDGE